MDQKQEVVSANLLLISEGLMTFVEVDEPRKAARVGGDNIVLFKVILFSGDVASVRDVFNSQGGL